jgi:hypothetical protein
MHSTQMWNGCGFRAPRWQVLCGLLHGTGLGSLPLLPCCLAAHPRPPHLVPPTGEFTHAFTALRTIVAKEGRRGLFAGYGSFLLRDLPFDAIEFVSYEAFKQT